MIDGQTLDQIQAARNDHLHIGAALLQSKDLFGVHVREVDGAGGHLRSGRHDVLHFDWQPFQRGGVQVADQNRFSIRDDQVGEVCVVCLAERVVLQRVARLTLALVGALRVDADLRARNVLDALVDVHALRFLVLIDSLALRTRTDRSERRSLTLVVAIHRLAVDQVAALIEKKVRKLVWPVDLE